MTCSKFMCTNQFFPMTFSRYCLLLFLFHSLEVHFMNSYNNDQMFVGPLSIKTKHLSLVLSKHRKYRAVSQLSLPVPFCLVHWTTLYRFTDYPSRDHNVKRWMVMLTWLCRFHVRNFRIWKELKENWKELSQADNWWGNMK